jgi:hypothetical protein
MKPTPLMLLALFALRGCDHPLIRPRAPAPPPAHVSDDALQACASLHPDEIRGITHASVLAARPSDSGSGLCHFTLDDGQWFDLILIRWPDVKMYTSAQCGEWQNGPTWGMVRHPFCSALAGPHEAWLQSAAHGGMAMDRMQSLLDVVMERLAREAGTKAFRLDKRLPPT